MSGFFPRVNRNDKVRHSARKENAVSDLLNSFGYTGISGSRPRQPDYNRVQVYNASETVMSAGSPVVLSGAVGDEMICKVVYATDVKKPFGILLSPLQPGEIGSALFTGVIAAEVYVANVNHEYVTPYIRGENLPSELTSASGGICRILQKTKDAAERQICLLQLSAAVADNDEYRNYFKVIIELADPSKPEGESNPKKIKVIDGANPFNELCGRTDLGNVPRAELDYATLKDVYLTASGRFSTGKYILDVVLVTYGSNPPNVVGADGSGSILLAEITAEGIVFQRYPGGEASFRSRYFC